YCVLQIFQCTAILNNKVKEMIRHLSNLCLALMAFHTYHLTIGWPLNKPRSCIVLIEEQDFIAETTIRNDYTITSASHRPIQSIGIAVLIASFKKFEGRMPCKSHPNIFSKNGSPKFGSESLKCKARAESAILLRILFTSCKPLVQLQISLLLGCIQLLWRKNHFKLSKKVAQCNRRHIVEYIIPPIFVSIGVCIADISCMCRSPKRFVG